MDDAVSYEHLGATLGNEARAAFLAARRRLAGQRLYGFAIEMDSDGTSIGSVFNTQEALGEHLRGYLAEFASDLIDTGESVESLARYCRCSVDEWQCVPEGTEFEATNQWLANHRSGVPPSGSRSFDVESAEFFNHRRALFETCVRAMECLIAEGFFGDEVERDALILRVSIPDSNDREWLMESARRLNTRRVFDLHSDSWIT